MYQKKRSNASTHNKTSAKIMRDQERINTQYTIPKECISTHSIAPPRHLRKAIAIPPTLPTRQSTPLLPTHTFTTPIDARLIDSDSQYNCTQRNNAEHTALQPFPFIHDCAKQFFFNHLSILINYSFQAFVILFTKYFHGFY